MQAQSSLSEAQLLKNNAAHDQIRKNDFNRDREQKLRFEQSREKTVKDFQAAERKFDEQREAGLAAYEKSKKQKSPAEFGIERKIDDQKKQDYEKRYEEARNEFIKIKQRYGSKNDDKFEMKEYGLDVHRPRYSQYDRLHNKLLNQSKSQSNAQTGSGAQSGSSNFNQGGRPPFVPGNNPPSTFDQYQPGTDYIPPPPEMFEDIPPPPPPPMMPYEGQSVPYDAGFGEPPPPPPPPMDFDF